MAETQPKQIRMTEETFKQFQKICADNNLTAPQAMESLLLAYGTATATQTAPETKTDIDNFVAHLNAIQESYLHMIQLNKDSETRIRAEFVTKLESKDSIISDLQAKEKANSEKLSELKTDLHDKDILIKEQTKEIENLERNLNAANANNETLMQSIRDKERIISEASGKLDDYDNIKSSLNKKNEEIDNLKAEARNQADIISRMKTEAETKATQYELEKQLAVSQARNEYSEKLEKLRNDKEKLLDEVAKLKDYIRQLDQPKADNTDSSSEEDNPEQLTFE